MQPVVPCAGAIVFDDAGRLLLVRRGREPGRGQWCEPSGRCEPGESVEQACVRETEEETGLLVRVQRRLGSVLVEGAAGQRYDITDFACLVVGGQLRAGDDAAEVRWVSRAELGRLELVPGLLDCLTRWQTLPH